LQRLAASPAELLLVDWVLPDMDGCTLLEQAAQAGLTRPRRTVFLSAFDTPALRERALRLGADALCAKPLLPHTLRRLLDLDQPLPAEPPVPLATDADTTDPATLISELDSLLGEADSHALTLWEQHGSAFIDLLPGPQAKALAGAMQRVDFDEAQAALRGDKKT
ncbi:MAG TPA: response regulator, partial [Roseateles sp.]